MPSLTQQITTPEWLTKHDAAKRLDLSSQRVLAMAKAGEIQSKRERDPESGQKVVLLLASDVKMLCEKRDDPGTEKSVAL